MGNYHSLEIAGVDTIKTKMNDGTIRTIQGVRHVKNLKKNLLSIGQLYNLGCIIHTKGEILKMVSGNLVIMKVKKIMQFCMCFWEMHWKKRMQQLHR